MTVTSFRVADPNTAKALESFLKTFDVFRITTENHVKGGIAFNVAHPAKLSDRFVEIRNTFYQGYLAGYSNGWNAAKNSEM